MLFVLGQIVGDREPGRLGADEDVLGRADGRIVEQCSHGNVEKSAVADDRKEERTAQLAARVVAVFVAKDSEVVFAPGDVQLVALDASEWLKGRTSRAGSSSSGSSRRKRIRLPPRSGPRRIDAFPRAYGRLLSSCLSRALPSTYGGSGRVRRLCLLRLRALCKPTRYDGINTAQEPYESRGGTMLYRAFQVVFVTAMAALLILSAIQFFKHGGDKRRSETPDPTAVQSK